MAVNVRTSKRQPVPVDADIYEFLKSYSLLTGIPVARIVNRGLREHINDVLTLRMAAMQTRAAGDQAKALDLPIVPSAVYTMDDAMSVAPVLEANPQAQN